MKISDAIDGYFLSKTGNRNGDLSPKTIKLYRHLLSKLITFLGDPELETVSTRDLERFMATLSDPDRGLSSYAQSNYFKAICSFFRWSSGTLDTEPIQKHLRPPRVIAQEVSPFARDEITRLLSACEYTTRTCKKSGKPYTQSRMTETRDKAIICLLLDTGLRASELTRLTADELCLDTARLRVVPYYSGKKSRPREIPFGRNTKRILWQFLAENKPEKRKPLFGLTTTGLQRLFARLGDRAGVSGCHAHRFRHTFAIEYLRNGGDIFTLQYILGHSDLTMCRRYLAIAKADVQNAHAKASPVDHWV